MNSTADYWPDALDLIRIFHDSPQAVGQLVRVPDDDVPPPYDRLLVHHDHMTVTVEEFYKSAVNVRVLDVVQEEGRYVRQILLQRASDDAVVQYGIAQLNLEFLMSEVRHEIQSQQVPLGRILIEFNVLREVEPISFYRVTPGVVLCDLMTLDQPRETYGRTALIHVHDEPVVELLEIVTPCGDYTEKH